MHADKPWKSLRPRPKSRGGRFFKRGAPTICSPNSLTVYRLSSSFLASSHEDLTLLTKRGHLAWRVTFMASMLRLHGDSPVLLFPVLARIFAVVRFVAHFCRVSSVLLRLRALLVEDCSNNTQFSHEFPFFVSHALLQEGIRVLI